jgi:hypothetical protein
MDDFGLPEADSVSTVTATSPGRMEIEYVPSSWTSPEAGLPLPPWGQNITVPAGKAEPL